MPLRPGDLAARVRLEDRSDGARGYSPKVICRRRELAARADRGDPLVIKLEVDHAVSRQGNGSVATWRTGDVVTPPYCRVRDTSTTEPTGRATKRSRPAGAQVPLTTRRDRCAPPGRLGA